MHKKIYRLLPDPGGAKRISRQDPDGMEDLAVGVPAGFSYDDAVLTAELLKAATGLPDGSPPILLEHGEMLEDGIPALAVYPETGEGRTLPLVFLLHGFESSKEKTIRYGLHFAAAGFFTAIMDAPMHGQRLKAANLFYEKFDLSRNTKEAWVSRFFELITAYLNETEALIAHYARDPRVDPARIAVAGISMGGTVALLAAARDPNLRSAVAFIPALDYEHMPGFEKIKGLSEAELADARSMDPIHAIQTAPSAAVFVLSGGDDAVTGTCGAKKLDHRLKALYSAHPSRYVFREYPHVGHTVTVQMTEDAINWIHQALKDK